MKEQRTIVLDGNSLTVEDIVAIGIGDARVQNDAGAVEKARASRRFLEKKVGEKHVIYGVNTSFGPMCNKIINNENLETLQVNLIRSHAAGLGEPLKYYITRAIMAIRLNTLLKGYSGVRTELLSHMAAMINAGIDPMIPECGSVGASGDLIHLAHLALAIIGEGDVYYRGTRMTAPEAYKAAGMKPFTLSYKEGLALINGTSAMTGIAAFAAFSARKALNIACVTAAFSVEIFGGINDAYDRDLHAVKPHPGQIAIADTIRSLILGSRNITLRDEMHERIRSGATSSDSIFETDINVQDVYSIRCTPQVLAPVREALDYAYRVIETEGNSTNDNPVIIPEKEKIIHGGNFHGQSIAFAMDSLCIAVSTLGNLSERRINKLLDKKLNEGLPEHLIPGVTGLTMGFMGAQYLATSTAAENRTLASPVSVNSISCNASNQDVVSMGTVAARKAFRVVSNVKHILTLEILADLQAFSFRNTDKLAPVTERIYKKLSADFDVYDNTRIFHYDLVKFRKLLFSTTLFDNLDTWLKP
jgi:histidine ammonia-lyase